jgi:hypothetical protein
MAFPLIAVLFNVVVQAIRAFAQRMLQMMARYLMRSLASYVEELNAIKNGWRRPFDLIRRRWGKNAKDIERNPPDKAVYEVKGCDETVAKLRNLQRGIIQGILPVLQAQAKATCYHLLSETKPWVAVGGGGTDIAIQSGKLKIARQAHKFIKPASSLKFGDLVMHREWKSAVETGWRPTRSKHLIKQFYAGKWEGIRSIFEANRWQQNSSQKFTSTLNHAIYKGAKQSKNPIYVRQNKQYIDNFINTKLKAVGLTASGWWECISQLGWVKPSDHSFNVHKDIKKNAGTGIVNTSMTPSNQSITIQNTIGDSGGALSHSGGLGRVLAFRQPALEDALKDLVDRECRKSGLGR